MFGRGNRRIVVELPHGSEFARAAKSKDPEEQKTCRTAIDNVCRMLRVPGFQD